MVENIITQQFKSALIEIGSEMEKFRTKICLNLEKQNRKLFREARIRTEIKVTLKKSISSRFLNYLKLVKNNHVLKNRKIMRQLSPNASLNQNLTHNLKLYYRLMLQLVSHVQILSYKVRETCKLLLLNHYFYLTKCKEIMKKMLDNLKKNNQCKWL